jgi:hypothetical protein
MASGIAIGIPFYKNAIVASEEEGINVLNFDKVNDYVSLGTHPIISGALTFTFKCLRRNTGEVQFQFKSGTDIFGVFIIGNIIQVSTSTNSWFVTANNTGNIEKITIIKDISNVVTDIQVNDVSITPLTRTTAVNYNLDGDFIGRCNRFIFGNLYADSLVFDININNNHFYKGYNSGNQDSAWVDQTGNINGTVFGSPTTINLNV